MIQVLKVGDIVKGICTSGEYTVANSDMTKAEVIKVTDSYIDVKILEHCSPVFKIGYIYRDLKSEYFEKIETNLNTQQLSITTEGTTTTVKFDDGRTGEAKLYYKDTFNASFSLIMALSKATGIDMVEEVKKVINC